MEKDIPEMQRNEEEERRTEGGKKKKKQIALKYLKKFQSKLTC